MAARALALLLLAALPAAAASAAQKCQYSRITEMRAWVEDGRPTAEGLVNGQRVGILLDTGASMSFVHRSWVARLGLSPTEAPGYRAFGIGGETPGQAVHIDEFKFGHGVRKGWRVLVAGEAERRGRNAVYLGNDFFQGMDVEFDLAFGAVRLFQADGCENVALSYWSSEPVVSVPLASTSLPELTIYINGQAVQALLDSGASASVIDMDFAAKVGIHPQSPGVIPAGCGFGLGKQPVESWIGRFESVAIGSQVIRSPSLRFADLWKDVQYTETGSRLPRRPQGLPSVLLGADFLRTHRVLIANSQRKLYFSYGGGTVFPVSVSPGCNNPGS